MNERLSDSLLKILRHQAYETFWDGEEDLETFLEEKVALDQAFVAMGAASLTYADMVRYVFHGEVTDGMQAMAVAYLRDAVPEQIPDDYPMITVFTSDDPATSIYARDLFDIKPNNQEGE
ncbi:hypothetical protein PR1_56 [Providencia phage vB_PreS_PR1]|uniref:Uncharacterized protein n=1 Tax=Providencia phage vB_PreS_PR1 TaxID=1931407 RepID=A0A1S6KV25_9CAUD|nr:hypothetical protein FDH30_gp057 [Providencia phage vB_PreS_PR1]AQT25297.1 hypothetical protein PR1_56 [Providencia phage vB_PreS_PR1]